MQNKRKSLYLRPRRAPYKPGGYANPFFKMQKPKKSRRFYWSLGLLFASLAAWMYFLFWSSAFQISDWQVSGLKTYDKNEITQNLQDFMSTRKFFIFSFSNIFIFNANDFKNYLNNNYAFRGIKITKYYPHKIIVELEEKAPKETIYNQDKIYVVSEDGTVVLQKEGIEGWFSTVKSASLDLTATSTPAYAIDIEKILADAKSKGLTDYPIFCDAYFSGNPGAGQAYPGKATLTIINDFIAGLNEKTNIKIKLAAIVKNQINPKIVIYTENGWEIYLNAEDSGQKQFYKLYVVFQEQIKDLNKRLEYIDLRFGDRVYIK